MTCLISAVLAAARSQTDGNLDSSPTGLTPAGLFIMVVSIGAILTLLVSCYARVLRARGPDAPGGSGSDARS